MSGQRLGLSVVVACALAVLVPSAAAGAFSTGVGVSAATATERNSQLDRARAAGARLVRIGVPWHLIAPSRPANPADPADPGYNFAFLDTQINETVAHGLRPMLTVGTAPPWAEGGGRPAAATKGSWKPDPEAFRDFATALARRYSGRVRYYQAWNEPNLSQYLSPQYAGKRKPVGALHYRRLLNAFYDGVKGVSRGNLVVTGGTAPYGDRPGGQRTRPLAFWRDVLCLRKKKNRLLGAKCNPKPKFDVLAHHLINTSGAPRRSALHPDDASTADLGSVRKTLRAAEKRHRIAGSRRRHQIWVTEIWWESNPPDRVRGLPLAKQARYLEETMFLAWKGGAKAVINLLLEDPPSTGDPLASNDSGLYFSNGQPKPALTAFRFPFVAERISRQTVRAWGRAPAGGQLTIEVSRKGGWKKLGGRRVGANRVFTDRLRLRGKAKLRARVGGETSLVWSQR